MISFQTHEYFSYFLQVSNRVIIGVSFAVKRCYVLEPYRMSREAFPSYFPCREAQVLVVKCPPWSGPFRLSGFDSILLSYSYSYRTDDQPGHRRGAAIRNTLTSTRSGQGLTCRASAGSYVFSHHSHRSCAPSPQPGRGSRGQCPGYVSRDQSRSQARQSGVGSRGSAQSRHPPAQSHCPLGHTAVSLPSGSAGSGNPDALEFGTLGGQSVAIAQSGSCCRGAGDRPTRRGRRRVRKSPSKRWPGVVVGGGFRPQ
jgi:hypothetical protein